MSGEPVARTYDGRMHAPDTPKPPAPICAPAQIGPCAGCGHATHRYGLGGGPLCSVCHAPVLARQAKKPAAV